MHIHNRVALGLGIGIAVTAGLLAAWAIPRLPELEGIGWGWDGLIRFVFIIVLGGLVLGSVTIAKNVGASFLSALFIPLFSFFGFMHTIEFTMPIGQVIGVNLLEICLSGILMALLFGIRLGKRPNDASRAHPNDSVSYGGPGTTC
jgi:hypothetical protein